MASPAISTGVVQKVPADLRQALTASQEALEEWENTLRDDQLQDQLPMLNRAFQSSCYCIQQSNKPSSLFV